VYQVGFTYWRGLSWKRQLWVLLFLEIRDLPDGDELSSVYELIG
jgi:hypothetical protein